MKRRMLNVELNADFSKPVVVHSSLLNWVDSPMPGVRRRMLDRIGNEVARATSIVSYAPGSLFSEHTHDGGEEFIVLEGVFQDEHGDYPVGSYIRNPPQSRHTPGSELGCVIFVKLWQFDSSDRHHVCVNIEDIQTISDDERHGVTIKPLHSDSYEIVNIEYWDSETNVSVNTLGGAEILVLNGSFTYNNEICSKGTWLRIPIEEPFIASVGASGAQVWVKTGHLRYIQLPAQA